MFSFAHSRCTLFLICSFIAANRADATASVSVVPDPDTYSCSQFGYITFEDLPDSTNLTPLVISGVQFTTTDGFTWRVGDFDTGFYNGKYPTGGGYTSEGTHWAWLGVSQSRGRLDFPNGPASYFSLIASVNVAPLSLDAYDAGGVLLETAGPSPLNFNTGEMVELKITRPTADIAYVIVGDQGNFFLVDAICTDAPGTEPPPIIPPVSSPSTRRLLAEEAVDANLPTIVLTHGLQGHNPGMLTADELWTGFGDGTAGTIRGAGGLLRDLLGIQANVFQYVWDEAAQGLTPNGSNYKQARAYVYDAGQELARLLMERLESSYAQPVHFVGHSLGTAVNAYASRRFLYDNPGVAEAQITTLDYPTDLAAIPFLNEEDEEIYRFDDNFFANVLPIERPGLDLRIDNYYSLTGGAVGGVANGPIYNHPPLEDPNDIDDRIFFEGFSNDHSGVHQWYRWTMEPADPEHPSEDTVCDGHDWGTRTIFGVTVSRKPAFFDDSLNPCQKGWYWALSNPNAIAWEDRFPTSPEIPAATSMAVLLDISIFVSFGCSITTFGSESTVDCQEASSPFGVADVSIPPEAEYLSFEYSFPNTGDGDYAAVLLGDTPIWILSGSSVMQPGVFYETGPLPIAGLTDNRRLTIALYGVGEPNAEFELRNLSVLERSENLAPVAVCQDVSVPTDTGVCLADGSVDDGSFDPDGDEISTIEDPAGPYGLGRTDVLLTVTDTSDVSDTCSGAVTVTDEEPPSVVCPSDLVVECTSDQGTAVSFAAEVTDNCSAVPDTSCTPASGTTFSIGVSPVSCGATDESGNTHECFSSVTVEDTTPPGLLYARAIPGDLWPPNNKMVPVLVDVATTDVCDAEPSCNIVSISSNEAEKGPPDTVITGDLTADIRAQRDGNGTGRVYTLAIACTDISGNEVDRTVQVLVPHDQRTPVCGIGFELALILPLLRWLRSRRRVQFAEAA